MSVKIGHNDAWLDIAKGMRLSRVSTAGSPYWESPSKAYIRYGGRWVDIGYVPVSPPPGDPEMVWGSPYGVVISWEPANDSPLPSVYTARLYSQGGTLLASKSVPMSARVYQVSFGNTGTNRWAANLDFYSTTIKDLATLTPDTNYYVTITASSPTMTPTVSNALRIRTGHLQETREDPDQGWVDTDSLVVPVPVSATSTYSSAYDISKTVSAGAPGTGGPLAPFTDYWVSKDRKAARAASTPNDMYEGLTYTMPTGVRRRLKGVQVVCEQAHNAYLAIKSANEWKGGITAAQVGLNSSSYLSGYAHDYLRSNIAQNNNVKYFNVLTADLEFSEIQQMQLLFNNFVDIFGTPAVAGSSTSTSTQITIPPGYIMVTSSTRKRVYLLKTYSTVQSQATYFCNPDTGEKYVAAPTPPAGAVWPTGATSGNYDYVISNNILHFRPLKPDGSLDSYVDGCTYLRTGSTLGPVITRSMTQVFTPALLGTTTSTTYVSGSPHVPAYRARVFDVRLDYQVWGNLGTTHTVVTRQAAATVAGPTAW